MSWPLKKLKNITQLIDYGLTASANNEVVGPLFLRITDLTDSGVDWDRVPRCKCDDKKRVKNLLKTGDIVFARTGATTGKSYLISDLEEDTVFASYLIRVRPNEKIHSAYLAHFFKSPRYWYQIEGMSSGATLPGVNASKLADLEIPLPPLKEQKRIAAILNKADAIRQKRQRAIKLADDFLRSVFLDMFGDPVTNPKGWVRCKFSDLIELVTYGLTVRPEYIQEGVSLISAREIRTGNVILERAPKISQSDFTKLSEKAKPKVNDILFSKTGSIGHCAIVSSNEPFAVTQNAARIVPNLKKVNPIFLLALLRTKYFYDLSNREAKGNAVKDLQLGVMKNFDVYCPPLEKQDEYVKLRESIIGLCNKQKYSIEESYHMFNSLSQKAFAGDL